MFSKKLQSCELYQSFAIYSSSDNPSCAGLVTPLPPPPGGTLAHQTKASQAKRPKRRVASQNSFAREEAPWPGWGCLKIDRRQWLIARSTVDKAEDNGTCSARGRVIETCISVPPCPMLRSLREKSSGPWRPGRANHAPHCDCHPFALPAPTGHESPTPAVCRSYDA